MSEANSRNRNREANSRSRIANARKPDDQRVNSGRGRPASPKYDEFVSALEAMEVYEVLVWDYVDHTTYSNLRKRKSLLGMKFRFLIENIKEKPMLLAVRVG